MISVFGIVSVAVALISVVIIILHNRVMSKRTPVDTYLTELEDLLREKIEILYHASLPGTELQVLCNQCIDLDLSSIINAMPDIDRASMADLHEYEHESNRAIQETTEALNQAIKAYNSFITGSLPVVLMSRILALTTEEFY